MEHWISLASAFMSFVGLMFVAVQLRRDIKQREAQSLIEIYNINRDLLTLGFSHPQLFDVLHDKEIADPIWERHYLQLWLNQSSLIHTFLNHATITGEVKESLLRDLADFVAQDNVKKHWAQFGIFYPDSFRELVADLMKKEPLEVAALEGAKAEKLRRKEPAGRWHQRSLLAFLKNLPRLGRSVGKPRRRSESDLGRRRFRRRRE